MTLAELQTRISAMASLPDDAWRASTSALQVVYGGGIREHFQSSTSPDGIPWEPLKFPRPSGGSKPLLDKGLLQASTSALVTDSEVTLSANGPGAALNQLGGKIVPVNAKALTIPLTREAQRVGSPRRFPRKLFKPRGKDYLAESIGKGKRARIVVHYIFRDSVTVPARPFLGISDATQERAEQVITTNYVALAKQRLGLQ